MWIRPLSRFHGCHRHCPYRRFSVAMFKQWRQRIRAELVVVPIPEPPGSARLARLALTGSDDVAGFPLTGLTLRQALIVAARCPVGLSERSVRASPVVWVLAPGWQLAPEGPDLALAAPSVYDRLVAFDCGLLNEEPTPEEEDMPRLEHFGEVTPEEDMEEVD